MKTQTLIKISLIISLISLLILLVLVNFLEPKIKKIDEISWKDLDKYVKVKANITNVRETKGLYILTLEDDSAIINAIVYKDNETLNFSFPNQEYEILGKVVEYKNKLEIEIEKIEKPENFS